MRSSWNFSPNSSSTNRLGLRSAERDGGANVQRHAAAILRMIRHEGSQGGTRAQAIWAEVPAMVRRALRPDRFEEDANALLQALLDRTFTLDALWSRPALMSRRAGDCALVVRTILELANEQGWSPKAQVRPAIRRSGLQPTPRPSPAALSHMAPPTVSSPLARASVT